MSNRPPQIEDGSAGAGSDLRGAELCLALAEAAVDRVAVDVAVVPCHAGERPLRGTTARADWRLCGRLSGLIQSGRLAEGAGHAALLPTRGGLRARLVLALGLGPRGTLDADALSDWSEQAVARCLALRAGTMALAVPAADALELPARVDGVLWGAFRGWRTAATPGRCDLRLELLPASGSRQEIGEHLRDLAAQPLPGDVRVEVTESAGSGIRRMPRRGTPWSGSGAAVK